METFEPDSSREGVINAIAQALADHHCSCSGGNHPVTIKTDVPNSARTFTVTAGTPCYLGGSLHADGCEHDTQRQFKKKSL